VDDGKAELIHVAVHNFQALVDAGGPLEFFNEVAEKKGTLARAKHLSDKLKFYKRKGCRDTLIELRR
jgi:hypothetical protein